jgi:hypothetical protein
MIGDEDLDMFFDLDDFGLSFTIKLQGLAVVTLIGLFDEQVEVIENDQSFIRPAVTFKSSQVVGIDRGHTVTNDATGIEYRLFKHPEPDGFGLTRFYLVK